MVNLFFAWNRENQEQDLLLSISIMLFILVLLVFPLGSASISISEGEFRVQVQSKMWRWVASSINISNGMRILLQVRKGWSSSSVFLSHLSSWCRKRIKLWSRGKFGRTLKSWSRTMSTSSYLRCDTLCGPKHHGHQQCYQQGLHLC